MVLMSLLKYLAANMAKKTKEKLIIEIAQRQRADVNYCCLLSMFTVRTAIINEKIYTIFCFFF